jgi:hypothetical protein
MEITLQEADRAGNPGEGRGEFQINSIECGRGEFSLEFGGERKYLLVERKGMRPRKEMASSYPHLLYEDMAGDGDFPSSSGRSWDGMTGT